MSFFGILKFHKIRHCEALKKEGVISFIKTWTRLLPHNNGILDGIVNGIFDGILNLL